MVASATATVTEFPNPKESSGLEAAKGELHEPERPHLQVDNTGHSKFRQAVDKFLWRGGSGWDALLNSASAQVGQVILTIPTSLAQMGFTSGILMQLMCAVMGVWTAYLLCVLYNEFNAQRQSAGIKDNGRVTQYHEVVEYFAGRWMRRAALFFNIISLIGLGVVQIVACASDVYIMNPSLNKRDWALVFGGLSLLTILLPSFHNYRVWSFLGLLATTYTSWYMVGASVDKGRVPHTVHNGPSGLRDWFVGFTNILFAYGGHSITVEIMHAMWRPRRFGWIYGIATLYVLTLTLPDSISMYWAYGNSLLKGSNALAHLDKSNARDTAIVLMVIHQCVAFGLFTLPVYFMWEKAIGTHTKPYWIRLPSRIPVVLVIWFFALLVPFFSLLNSIFGALLTSFATYIIPSVVYIITFRKQEARQNAVMKPPAFIGRSWNIAFAINIFIIFSILTIGVGFGGWASIAAFRASVSQYKVFGACYQCAPASG
ncbi:hypothetical protein WJX74_006936 [Apatococcus lobatus]